MNGTAPVKVRHLRRATRRVLGFITGSGRVVTIPSGVRFAPGDCLPSGRRTFAAVTLPAYRVPAGVAPAAVSPDADRDPVTVGEWLRSLDAAELDPRGRLAFTAAAARAGSDAR